MNIKRIYTLSIPMDRVTIILAETDEEFVDAMRSDSFFDYDSPNFSESWGYRLSMHLGKGNYRESKTPAALCALLRADGYLTVNSTLKLNS